MRLDPSVTRDGQRRDEVESVFDDDATDLTAEAGETEKPEPGGADKGTAGVVFS